MRRSTWPQLSHAGSLTPALPPAPSLPLPRAPPRTPNTQTRQTMQAVQRGQHTTSWREDRRRREKGADEGPLLLCEMNPAHTSKLIHSASVSEPPLIYPATKTRCVPCISERGVALLSRRR